jgi:hypothetical protein
MDFIWALAVSTHLGLAGDYNEVHPHVRFIEDGAIAGAYYNSVERISFYTGYRVEQGPFGAEFALVTGYPDIGPIAPYVRGTYDLNDNVRGFISPAGEYVGEGSTVGAVLGVEFRF